MFTPVDLRTPPVTAIQYRYMSKPFQQLLKLPAVVRQGAAAAAEPPQSGLRAFKIVAHQISSLKPWWKNTSVRCVMDSPKGTQPRALSQTSWCVLGGSAER